jgi:hypothetical protein
MAGRRIHTGPRGGKYYLVKGRKVYVSRTRKVKSRKSNKFGNPCSSTPHQQIPGAPPSFSWHYTFCMANDGRTYLHVTASYDNFQGFAEEAPSVHVGYRPDSLHLGPILWSNEPWVNFQDSAAEPIIVQFIKDRFNEQVNAGAAIRGR